MSSTRTAGRRDSRPPGARTARTTRTTSHRASSSVAAPLVDQGGVDVGPLAGDLGPAPRRRTGRSRAQGKPRPRSPRHRILLVCTAVLAAGFFAVLLLNTVISQGAFRQHELEIQLILLAEKEEALARAVQQAEAPLEVEKAARKLGMVPAAAPVFLRLSDGRILGEPVPAPAPTAPVDFAGAPGIQPTPKPTPSGAAVANAPNPGVDPATSVDPTTGIDPALDPATGLDPASDPGASPAASPAADPAVSPSPVLTQQGVNP
jgi:hypothetical protein